MDSSPLQQLLRLFYRYEAQVLLCLQDGVISGYLKKSDIEELMSDLALAQKTTGVPITPVKNLEQLLELHHQEGILTDAGRFLPVVNELWEEEGLYNRAQIIQIWEKPRISVNRPETRQPASPAPKIVKSGHAKPPEKFPFSEQPATPPAENRSQIQITPPQEINQPQELSTLALEALPIPMIALDTRGNLLFYNHDWSVLFGKDFDVMALMKKTRNLMAEMAFAGKLEVDSLLEIDGFAPGPPIRMKTIRDERKAPGKVIGYIFWVENPLPQTNSTPEPSSENRKKPQVKATPSGEPPPGNSKRFMGRTLPEILEEEERQVLAWAMEEAGHNQSNAAMLLGIPRQTFSYRYKKLFGK